MKYNLMVKILKLFNFYINNEFRIRDGIGSDLDRIFQNPYPILNKNNISISISTYYG